MFATRNEVMKKILLTLFILAPGLSMLSGQGNPEMMKQQKAEAMDRLSFMVGTWEGTGYYQQGRSERSTFDIHETIEPKLGGLVYLVEGLGTHKGDPVHNALALISWDITEGTYVFESHTFDGRTARASGTVEGSTFTWGFDVPGGGNIQYTMEFDEETWHETGKYSPDGDVWYPFMEMNLEKIKE